MNSELTSDQIKNFLGKDLYDNCNVIIDPASAVPKMKAAEQAKLMELAQSGVLNLQDPANRSEFLERMDIIGFDSGYGKDAKRADYENDMLDELALNPNSPKPVVMDVDNHDIHLAVHGDREKEPSFQELPFEVQQQYAMHRQQHEQLKAQAEQMQMMQAAMTAQMTGQPPQAPQQAPNPMEQQERLRKGSGITSKTKNAINPDLAPFGANTKG